MKLWTYQGVNFNITSDRLDLAKSTWDIPGIGECYCELGRRLGQEKPNFIWCVPKPQPEYWPERFEWVLDVGNVPWIVDAYIWCKIIGRSSLPQSLRHRWRSEAIEKGLDVGAYEKEQSRNYDTQQPPEGGWWEVLFISDVNLEGANILLEPPIPEERVLSARKV